MGQVFRVIAIISLVAALDCRLVAADELYEVPCEQVPMVLELSGGTFKCSTFGATAAELAKAREEAAKAKMRTGFLDIFVAPNATTHVLIFGASPDKSPKRMAAVFLSVAHPDHSLKTIPLRDFVSDVTDTGLLDGKYEFDWRTRTRHGDYDTQRYIETASSAALYSAMIWTCVAFTPHRDQSTSEGHKQRLLGYYCLEGDSELSDKTVTSFLSAFTVK